MLVYPNQRWLKEDLTTTWNLTPYTMCLLSAMIRDLVEVKIVDAQFYGLSREDFKKELEKFQPDLVGVSLLSSEYASIGDMAIADIKEVNKKTLIIAGGVHITTNYERVMQNKNIDYAMRGEGEYVLPALIKHLNGEGPAPTEGLVIRKSDGTLEVLPQAFVQDLDALPLPAYDMIDYKKYTMTVPRYGLDAPTVLPFARFPTTRGCPVGCTFCQVGTIAGTRIRMRSPANVMKELEYLKENYGIKFFMFEDDNAFFYKQRTMELLRLMVDSGLDMKWKATGVFLPTADEDMFKLMAASGCEMINVAIESGTERVLKKVIQKPLDLNLIPKKIALAQKHGLFVVTNFIIGLPSETWSEIRQSLKYAETCGADYVKIFNAIPLVGTKMYDMAKEGKYIVGDETTVDQRYSVMRGSDYDPKDLNILRVYEWDRINFTDPIKRAKTAKMMNISEEELDRIRLATRRALKFTEDADC